MTDTLNSYHSMYATLSAEITFSIGKISAMAREENGDNLGIIFDIWIEINGS